MYGGTIVNELYTTDYTKPYYARDKIPLFRHVDVSIYVYMNVYWGTMGSNEEGQIPIPIPI